MMLVQVDFAWDLVRNFHAMTFEIVLLSHQTAAATDTDGVGVRTHGCESFAIMNKHFYRQTYNQMVSLNKLAIENYLCVIETVVRETSLLSVEGLPS